MHAATPASLLSNAAWTNLLAEMNLSSSSIVENDSLCGIMFVADGQSFCSCGDEDAVVVVAVVASSLSQEKSSMGSSTS